MNEDQLHQFYAEQAAAANSSNANSSDGNNMASAFVDSNVQAPSQDGQERSWGETFRDMGMAFLDAFENPTSVLSPIIRPIQAGVQSPDWMSRQARRQAQDAMSNLQMAQAQAKIPYVEAHEANQAILEQNAVRKSDLDLQTSNFNLVNKYVEDASVNGFIGSNSFLNNLQEYKLIQDKASREEIRNSTPFVEYNTFNALSQLAPQAMEDFVNGKYDSHAIQAMQRLAGRIGCRFEQDENGLPCLVDRDGNVHELTVENLAAFRQNAEKALVEKVQEVLSGDTGVNAGHFTGEAHLSIQEELAGMGVSLPEARNFVKQLEQYENADKSLGNLFLVRRAMQSILTRSPQVLKPSKLKSGELTARDVSTLESLQKALFDLGFEVTESPDSDEYIINDQSKQLGQDKTQFSVKEFIEASAPIDRFGKVYENLVGEIRRKLDDQRQAELDKKNSDMLRLINWRLRNEGQELLNKNRKAKNEAQAQQAQDSQTQKKNEVSTAPGMREQIQELTSQKTKNWTDDQVEDYRQNLRLLYDLGIKHGIFTRDGKFNNEIPLSSYEKLLDLKYIEEDLISNEDQRQLDALTSLVEGALRKKIDTRRKNDVVDANAFKVETHRELRDWLKGQNLLAPNSGADEFLHLDDGSRRGLLEDADNQISTSYGHNLKPEDFGDNTDAASFAYLLRARNPELAEKYLAALKEDTKYMRRQQKDITHQDLVDESRNCSIAEVVGFNDREISWFDIAAPHMSLGDINMLPKKKREKVFDKMERIGLISPREQNFFTELGQGTARGFYDHIVRGTGATLEELGVENSLEEFAERKLATNKQWNPPEGYEIWSTNPSFWGQTIGNGLATTLPSFAFGAATTLVTQNPVLGYWAGTASFGIPMYGDKVREYRRDMPDIGDGGIMALAFFDVLGESLIENCGPMEWTHGVYKSLVKGATLEALNETAKRFGWAATKKFLKGMAYGALEEGAEEIAQMYWDIFTRSIVGTENLPWPTWNQVKDEFGGGFIAGLGMAGGGEILQRGITGLNRWSHQRPGANAQQQGTVNDEGRGPARKEGDLPSNEEINQSLQDAHEQSRQERLAEWNRIQWDNVVMIGKAIGVTPRMATPEEMDGFYQEFADKNGITKEEAKQSGEIHGHYNEDTNEMLINPDSSRGVAWAAGHEFKHWLDKNHPELVDKFNKMVLESLTQAGREALVKTKETYGKAGDGQKEFICDAFATLTLSPNALNAFCQKIEQKEQGAGIKFVETVREYVRHIMDYLAENGLVESEQFTYYEQLEQECADILANAAELNHYGRKADGSTRSFDAQAVNTSEVKTDPAFFQHRKGADAKTGVVPGHKLTGKYSPTTGGNFIFWEDKNGQKWLANGHHRWQMVQEQNVPRVNGIVLKESEGVTKEQAREESVKVNLREGTATPEDAAEFFRNNKMTVEEAQADSLLKEQDTNRNTSNGYWIGTYAGDNLYENFRDGSISAGKAATIAEVARGNMALEDAGLKMAKTMPAAQLRSALSLLKQSLEKQGDKQTGGEQLLFNGLFDDSAIKLAEQQSRIAAKHIGELRNKVSIAKKAADLGKDKANIQQLRKELGVNVRNFNEVKQKLGEWQKELNAWEHYDTNQELINQINNELNGVESQKPAAKPAKQEAQKQQKQSKQAKKEQQKAKATKPEKTLASPTNQEVTQKEENQQESGSDLTSKVGSEPREDLTSKVRETETAEEKTKTESKPESKAEEKQDAQTEEQKAEPVQAEQTEGPTAEESQKETQKESKAEESTAEEQKTEEAKAEEPATEEARPTAGENVTAERIMPVLLAPGSQVSLVAASPEGEGIVIKKTRAKLVSFFIPQKLLRRKNSVFGTSIEQENLLGRREAPVNGRDRFSRFLSTAEDEAALRRAVELIEKNYGLALSPKMETATAENVQKAMPEDRQHSKKSEDGTNIFAPFQNGNLPDEFTLRREDGTVIHVKKEGKHSYKWEARRPDGKIVTATLGENATHNNVFGSTEPGRRVIEVTVGEKTPGHPVLEQTQKAMPAETVQETKAQEKAAPTEAEEDAWLELLDRLPRHEDINTLAEGDYVAFNTSNGKSSSGFVTGIGQKNITVRRWNNSSRQWDTMTVPKEDYLQHTSSVELVENFRGQADLAEKIGFHFTEEIQSAIAEKAAGEKQEAPNPHSDSAGGVVFSYRKKEAPKKTQKGYKLMRIDNQGNLYALFIDRANQMRLGSWYDADSPGIESLKKLQDGIYLVDRDGNATPFTRANMPSVKEVDTATANGSRYMKIDRYKDGSQRISNIGVNGSGTVASFAYRPGWHATNAPSAPHIGGGQRRGNEVWVEIEYAADNDFRQEAASRATPMKDGRPNPKEAQLDHIPEDGFYYYRTNSNADEKQDWILTGSIKPVRILSDAEVESINREGGFRPDAQRKEARVDTSPTKVNQEFNNELDKYDQLDSGHVFRLGLPGQLLQDYGFSENPLELSRRVIEQKANDQAHPFVPQDLKNLPDAIQKPLAIFKYSDPAKLNLIVDLSAGGKNFLVGVQLNSTYRGNMVNNIRGLLPKDTHEWLNWIQQDKALYLDKNKIQDLIAQSGINLLKVSYLNLDSVLKIIRDFDNANHKVKNSVFSYTPRQWKEMDKAYLDAVQRGDMATAERMVREREAEMGYSNDESWKMDHRAPNSKDNVSLIDLKDSGLVPADYWDHPEWYTYSPEERESFRIIKAALELAERRKAEGNERPVSIMVYRAVDKTKNRLEGRLRNGDWVTPSRAYAENEGRDNPNGYRIIRQRCLLRNLYWDGNSIAELGFDDGSDYSYKDTANNRKLRDVVTYDDEGNVIPLSKRFNKREYDTRFSYTPKYYETNFADNLKAVVAPGSKVTDNVFVSFTPEVFSQIGITRLPMMMSPRHLRLNYYDRAKFIENFGQMRQDEHAHGLYNILTKLPNAIAHPIAIIANMAEHASPGSIIAITDIDYNGKKIIVPIAISVEARISNQNIDSHLVLTVYDKNNWVNNLLTPAINVEKQKNNKVGIFYLDTKKAEKYRALSVLRKGAASFGILHNIDDEGSPVKGFNKKQTDTLQFKRWFGKSKVVDDAGNPLVVYHGSKWDPLAEAPGKAVFSHGKVRNTSEGVGFYFTADKSMANSYGTAGEYFLSLQNPVDPFGKLDLLSEDEIYDISEREDLDENEIDEAIKEARNEKVRAKMRNVIDALKAKGYQFYNEIERDFIATLDGNSTVESVLDTAQVAVGFVIDENVDNEKFTNDFRRAEIEEFGIDGYVSRNYGDGAGAFVAFLPNQAKSATDNVGTFDNGNDDVRFSYTARRQQVNPILEEGKYKEEYQQGLEQDLYRPLSDADVRRRAGNALARMGGMKAALEAFLSGKKRIEGPIGTMMAKAILNSPQYQELTDDQREAFGHLYRESRTEAGRVLRLGRLETANLQDFGKLQKFVEEFRSDMQATHPKEDVRKKIKGATGVDIDNLPEELAKDNKKLDEFLTGAYSAFSNTSDKFYEYWVNAILSALTTHMSNTSGNFGNGLYELTAKRFAEACVNLFMRHSKGATFGEFRHMWRALNVKQAWESSKPLLYFDMLTPEGKFDEHGVKAALPGKTGHFIRTPGRFLRFADHFVKCIVRPVEAAAMAYREAKSQKLNKQQTMDYIQKQLEDENSTANEFGRQRALELTFNENPGPGTNALIQMRNKVPFMRYLFPFIRTPSNLLRQGIRKGPLGIVNLAWETGQLAFGNRKVDNEYIAHIAEQIVFWGACMMLAAGHGDDDEPWITGNSRVFGNEGRFKNVHQPPMSIKIGGKWYSYRRIEPLSTGLATFADGYNAYREARDGQKMTSAMRMMMTGAGKLLSEKSYLQSFNEAYQLLSDPERHAEDWLANFGSSWVPNAYRQTVNAFHNYSPNYKAGSENWILNTFQQTFSRAGLYHQVPKIDYFGRPVPKDLPLDQVGPGSVAWRLIMPVARREADNMDPVEQLMWNYNKTAETPYWPSLPSPHFQHEKKRYAVTDYDAYATRAGQLAHEMMLQAVKDGKLNVKDPGEYDINQIKRMFSAARKQAKMEFLEKGWVEEQ